MSERAIVSRQAESPRLSTEAVVVADEPQQQSLVGGGRDLPEQVAAAVQAEGSAAAQGSARTPSTALLFCPDAAPRAVALVDVPHLVNDDDNFVWIDLYGYGEDDLREVARLLRLHPRGVEAALAPWQRPQLNAFKDQIFVSATVARMDDAAYKVRATQLDMFVGNNYLVMAHRPPVPFAERILLRARQSPELVQLDAAFMLYIILDELLAYYETLNEQVQGQVEEIEERALTDTSEEFLSDLLRFKRYAFALGQLADQHREIFAAFLRPDFRWVSGNEVETYFRGLETRFLQLRDVLYTAREAVNGAFDIYVSQVSHRTNAVIKVLTMVSAVLFSMTVIIGLFSTSVQGLPLVKPASYLIMLTLLAAVTSAILYTFHRKNWF